MLLHVWSYDFYDMDYFTESLDGHVIKLFITQQITARADLFLN